MRIFNDTLYEGDIASFNSSPMKLDNIFGYSIQIIMTGNPQGSVVLQGSADSVQIQKFPTNWDNIKGSTQEIANAGTTFYNAKGVFYNWVRVVYTDSSGGSAVGTCKITGNCKGA